MAVFGVFVPFVALVGAVRLARPGSPWARRFYRRAAAGPREGCCAPTATTGGGRGPADSWGTGWAARRTRNWLSPANGGERAGPASAGDAAGPGSRARRPAPAGPVPAGPVAAAGRAPVPGPRPCRTPGAPGAGRPGGGPLRPPGRRAAQARVQDRRGRDRRQVLLAGQVVLQTAPPPLSRRSPRPPSRTRESASRGTPRGPPRPPTGRCPPPARRTRAGRTGRRDRGQSHAGVQGAGERGGVGDDQGARPAEHSSAIPKTNRICTSAPQTGRSRAGTNSDSGVRDRAGHSASSARTAPTSCTGR